MLLILLLQIAKKNVMHIYNDYCISIFTQENLSTLPTIIGIPFPDILPISISVEGVASLLSGLNHHKVPGPHNIPAYFLKELSNKLTLISH